MANRKTKKSPRRAMLYLIFMIIVTGLIYAVQIEMGNGYDRYDNYNYPDGIENFPLAVHYIDVGQGDSSLILFGGNAVLTDAGERNKAKTVTDYISDLGVAKLDFIIATHPHSDHIGGLPDVIEKFEVGKVIAPRTKAEMTPTTVVYEDFLLAVLNKGLKLTPAVSGETYTLYGDNGDTATLDIISPIYPQSLEYTDVNDYSVVFRLTYKDTAFLFTGDATGKAEADILSSKLPISANTLKVGHHGSNTSTSPDFLTAVNPRYAIIQSGAGNRYGHPTANILKRLKDNSVIIYRNDLDKNIVVYSDGENIAVKAGS